MTKRVRSGDDDVYCPSPKKVFSVVKVDIILTPECNWIENVKFLELVDVHDLDSVIEDVDKIKWDTTKYSNRLAARCWKNQKIQLEAYRDLYISGTGVVVCNTRRLQWGRVHPAQMLGFTGFKKEYRNKLLFKFYTDFDIVNCHFEMIRQICDASGIACVATAHFIDNREELYSSLVERYGVDRSAVKSLFLRLLYLGTFDGWSINNDVPRQLTATKQIKDLAIELMCIAQCIRNLNPILAACVENRNETNQLGCFLSYYLQEHELRLVSSVIRYLWGETDVLNHGEHKVCTYQYDGIQILTKNLDSYLGGVDALLKKIQDVGFEKTGLRMKWIQKKI